MIFHTQIYSLITQSYKINTMNYFINENEDSSIDILFAYDCSGSTLSCNSYHEKNQRILNAILEAIENIKKNQKKDINFKIVKWDNVCVEITTEELNEINRYKKGFGGTSPEKVCDYIKLNNFRGHLVLISDGEISPSSVDYCSNSLSEWSFKNVYVCLVSNCGEINESISCAFTRNCPHTIEILRNSNNVLESEVISVSNDDYRLLDTIDNDNINNISDFYILSEKIKDVLISITMGTKGNKLLYDKFIKLKNKLIRSQSLVKDNLWLDELSTDFDSGLPLDPNKLHKIWDEYYFNNDNEWVKQIDTFISWCNGSLSSTFNRKFITARIERAEVSQTVSPETVTLVAVSETNISHQCPISLEFSPNIIILMRKNGDSVFNSLSSSEINSIINCPLNALENIHIVKYIKTLFDSCISIEAYKELCEHGISTSSPLTREEIFGGLCLGNHKSHVLATNSTIRNILTFGKSLGNIDLWYAVLYFMIEKGHVTHLNEYLPNLREHMIFRLRNSKSYMCLSGLPTFPTYKVNLGLCLWTVIFASSCGSQFVKNPKNDPLRLHLSYTDEIIDLLRLINIYVPENVKHCISILKTLRRFLSFLKNNANRVFMFDIENRINALKYKAMNVGGKWICIDGHPDVEQIIEVRKELPESCNDLTIGEIIYTFNLCDVNKAESDIYLPFDCKVEDFVSENKKIWHYHENTPKTTVNISINTCRPFYYLRDKDKVCGDWKDKATKIYGKFMSLDNMFGNYISVNSAYPSKNDFLIYISDRYSRKGIKTLPICIKQFVDEIFEDHEHVLRMLEPCEFKRRWDASIVIKNRIMIE